MALIERYLTFLFEQDVRQPVKDVRSPRLFSILGGIQVDLSTFNMFRALTVSFQNNLRGCERVQDLEKQLCISNIKFNFLRKETEIIRRGDRFCNIQENFLQCREKIKNKLFKVNEQTKKLAIKIANIKGQIVMRKNKESEEKRKGEESRGLKAPNQNIVD